MNSNLILAKAKLLIGEFERSGVRELHVRAEGLELYLSAETGERSLTVGGVAVSADDLAARPRLPDGD